LDPLEASALGGNTPVPYIVRTTVYHCYSYLFWSDGNGSNAKIERSDLSGNNRTVLVTSAQGLVSPTTLVVDFSTQKLLVGLESTEDWSRQLWWITTVH